MRFSHRPPSSVILLALTALIVVPLLAVLQYQWLGQLAGQEYDRIRTGVRTAMFRGGMECNREFAGLLQSLSGIDRTSLAAGRREVALRVSNLQPAAAYRKFVTGDVVVVPMPNPESTFRTTERNGGSILVLRDLSMIGLSGFGPSDSVIGVALDRPYIVEQYIPGLLRSYLGSESDIPIDIVIFDSERSALSSVIGKNVIEPQEIVPLLMTPRFIPTPFLSDTAGVDFQPFPVDPRDSRPPRTDGWTVQSSNGWRAQSDTMIQRVGFGTPLLSAGISFRAGSLEEAVQSSRLRNLGLSFGILLLLSISILLLIRSAGKAQQLAQQQMEFVASVSHELRTPLAILKSAGENLSDGLIKDPSRARKYGDIIKAEVERLIEMVEKTLAYAGILSGEEILNRQSVDLSTVINDAIRAARQSGQSQGSAYRLTVEPMLPRVNADPAVLRSAFENLLSNAAKYGNHSQEIDVSARTLREGTREWVVVDVSDQGIGIPLKDIDRIFEPFVRAQNATNEQIRGSGLGLSLVKHAVQAHGGSVQVRSEVGKGSVFTIKLPLPSNDRDPSE